MKILKYSLIGIAFMGLCNSCAQKQKDEWNLVWTEDFDGPSIDESVWTRVKKGPSDWNDMMSLREDLAYIEDGQLVLLGKPGGEGDETPYVSGGVLSAGKKSFRGPARVEIKARFNCVKGFWPALWMMPDEKVAPGDYAEIDIMEHLNSEDIAYQTVHSRYTLNGGSVPTKSANGKIDRDGWNVYAAEIHRDSICLFINDAKTLTYPRVSGVDLQFPWADYPFFFILSNQLGGKWVGPLDDDPANFPSELRVDWIKVYERTEAEEPYEDEKAYVFTYFDNTRQDAGLLMAWSLDGYHWTPVNDGNPIFKPMVGHDRLLRDPSICQGPDGTFHLVWTVSWKEKGIGYASSRDLVHWSEQKEIPVMESFPSTRNTWAPELFYEASEGLFYIFWASTVPDNPEVSKDGSISEDQYNHRIYFTTTKDFETFSPTKLYFNPSFNVIDACVVRVPESGQLLMALKNENLNPPEKNIRLTRSNSMAEGFPTEVSGPVSGKEWSEGPTIIPIGKDLLMYYDKFREHRYGASVSHDGGNTWEDATELISVPEGMSHGTAIAVSKVFIEKLMSYKAE